MKKLIFTLVCLTFCLAASAQQYQDVVYLKNGRVIKGQIMEQIPNVSLRIETNGESLTLPMTDVEKITKEKVAEKEEVYDILNPNYKKPELEKFEPVKKETPILEETKPSQPIVQKRSSLLRSESGLKRGLTGFLETGYSLSLFDNDEFSEVVHVNGIVAYRFNPFLALGLGGGFRYFVQHDEDNDSTVPEMLVPLFASCRINMRDSKVTPYANIDIGYAGIPDGEYTKFGTMFSQGVGISIKLPQRTSLQMGFRYEMRIFDDSIDDDYLAAQIFSSGFRSIGLNMGLTF
jgi:hypothetical protein